MAGALQHPCATAVHSNGWTASSLSTRGLSWCPFRGCPGPGCHGSRSTGPARSPAGRSGSSADPGPDPVRRRGPGQPQRDGLDRVLDQRGEAVVLGLLQRLDHLGSVIWNFGVNLTIPTASVLLLLATGVKSRPLLVAAAIGLVICLVAGVIIGLVLWKEHVAQALGRAADRVASWLLRALRQRSGHLAGARAGRNPRADDRRGPHPLAAADLDVPRQPASRVPGVRPVDAFTGSTASQVSLVAAFAAFTFGMLAGSIPITPGGLGTGDAVYIAVMVAAGAPHSAAVAGDLVFRTLTYLLQITAGGITYIIWRRKETWRKPRATEPRSRA